MFIGETLEVEGEVAPSGWSDNRHVVTVAGSRAGKGTSAIIPNLLRYTGSVVCVDPKGENASVTAAHRGSSGTGEYGKGLGQDVYVLDPFMVADVPSQIPEMIKSKLAA